MVRRAEPPPRPTIIGRVAELEAVTRALSAAPLVTLVGPPGAGKTTLAHAVLARRAAKRRGGARDQFVDLSAASSALDVVRVLAAALGVPLPAVAAQADGRDRDASVPAELVERVLGSRGLRAPSTLVVLDNAEQCVEDVAWLVSAWLERAPARILVTSREALRIAREEVVPVPPLATPREDEPASAILASESVALVLARAGLPAREEDAPRLASLVRKLDGIPLALELAASRVAILGLAGVDDRISAEGATLDLLAHGRRDASARQATLRGAIAWSYALLSPEERLLYAALSAFRGSFGPEDAVAARPAGLDARRALDALQALCDKSLVARRGDGRLGLLSAIREHAAEQPRDPGTETRLAAHLASRSRQALAEVGSRRARAALGWLHAELENLLGAFDALARGGSLGADADPSVVESAAWLLHGVDAVVQRVGPGSMHASRLDALLAAALPEELEVALRVARARVHRDAGAMEAGEAQLRTAIERASAPSRPSVRAELGEALLARGAIDEAESALRLALSEARAVGSALGEQKAAARLGLVLHARGRLDEAQGFYELALDLAGRLASPALESAAHRDLGSLLLQRGAFARARAHYSEALARAPHDDLRLEGVVRGNLGIIELEEGELDAATLSFRRALECLRRIGDRTFEAHLLVYAGLTHFERGSPAEARALYARAIDTLAEVGDARMEGIARAARAVAIAALGEVGAPDNDLAVAARRLGGVEDPALFALIDVARAHVAMLGAEGAAEARQEALRVAQRTEALSARSDDLRFARRALVRALPAERFVFSPAGQGFVAPDGARIDLTRRPTLARLLDALVAKRLAAPGVAASFDELIAAGWPGERVLTLAAQNRLRVAVTTLRNMGLRHVLVFRDGGHLLDPEVPATIASPSAGVSPQSEAGQRSNA